MENFGSKSRSRRERMVRKQIAPACTADPRVLQAFSRVPRELFLPPDLRRWLAYVPLPLPIGHGQTISQPAIVARMFELAGLGPHARVLDVGAGSGYQTALLSQLCEHVCGIEIVPELAARAERALRLAGIRNASIHVRNAFDGLPEFAPYDAILVAAATPEVPSALLEQLKDGGRLIIPIGPRLSQRDMLLRALLRRRSPQRLVRFVRNGGEFTRTELDRVYFVPLVPGLASGQG